MDQTLHLDVPFDTAEQAQAVYNALFPDPELRPDEFTKTLTVSGTVLAVDFAAKTPRSLRVGVNGFMDTLALSVECVEAFS